MPQARSRHPRGTSPSFVSVAIHIASLLTLTPIPAVATAGTVDLRDGVRTTFYGAYNPGPPDVGDFYGWSIAFGDIDGDGYQDFLSSCANGDGPDDLYGPEHDAYLFFGRPRAEFDSLYAVDVPGLADIRFYKGGYSIACADLDNDGYDDMIMTEPRNSGSGVYVVFGRSRGQLLTVYDFNPQSTSYTPPDILIPGVGLGGWILDSGTPGGFDWATRTLVTGDFNGDSYGDFAFGEPEARGPFGNRAGAVHVVLGRPRSQFPSTIDPDRATSLPHPDFSIYDTRGEGFPFAMTAGDLDGDGMTDLVASSLSSDGEENLFDGRGEVHCFWGRTSWPTWLDTELGQSDFAMDYIYGMRMATGDLDGDGRDELVLGSYDASADLPDGRRQMGAYHIYFGRPRGEWPRWSRGLEMMDVLIVGSDLGEAFTVNGPFEWGMCFSMATGNIDGDGFDDLLIGAGRGFRPSTSNPLRAGHAYLIRGRPRGAWQPFIDLRDDHNTIFYGVDGCDASASCSTTIGLYGIDLFGFVTSMADVDNNGLDDIIIAAPFADGPGNVCGDCGEIYLLFDADTLATPIVTPRSSVVASLLPAYPNPFSSSTTFRFSAAPGVPISFAIYDVRGRRVVMPVQTGLSTGEEELVHWDGRDASGRRLASGVYFAKLVVGNSSFSSKVFLVH